ncbi:alpha/beta hydrolase [Paenibacillus sp. Marseille-Q4541]|uniref:alpha/beta fold hydrolase n=1 Tax=Paenibacillus sp. Marseille-Q4541 TaxID=2831522 RepID=UPI001BAB32BF|nr:alpha/beta hydrolase [Paenibacillus sp. Marseille-Q4541]
MMIEVEAGVQLYVEDLRPQDGGNGQTMMFIHGWPVNHRIFDYQMQMFPYFGFRCVSLDLRGFGKSDKPWHGYYYDRFAEDISLVMDMLNLENVILVGFSMGGAICARLIAKYDTGARVVKLVLAGAATPSIVKKEQASFGLPLAQIDHLLQQIQIDLPQALSDFGGTFFYQYISPEYKNWFQNMCLEGASYSILQTGIALRNEDVSTDLSQIQIPTAIFHGVHDQIAQFQGAVATQQHIPGSLLYRFEGSGHGLLYEEKNRFQATLLDFIQKT